MDKKICFVVCPIGADNSETRKRSDVVLKHIIKPVCEKNGYEVIRVHQLKTVDRIDHTIIEYLETAELVIADMTDHNAKLFTNLDIDKLQTFLLYRLSKKGKVSHLM